jgi:hypothetical protein
MFPIYRTCGVDGQIRIFSTVHVRGGGGGCTNFPHIWGNSEMELLQIIFPHIWPVANHIWLTASSYMGKYLRISSYMTLQLLLCEFLIYEENFILFLSVQTARQAESTYSYDLSSSLVLPSYFHLENICFSYLIQAFSAHNYCSRIWTSSTSFPVSSFVSFSFSFFILLFAT